MTANDASEIGRNYRNRGPRTLFLNLTTFRPQYCIYLNYFQRFWIIFEAQKTWLLNPHLIAVRCSFAHHLVGKMIIQAAPFANHHHHPSPKENAAHLCVGMDDISLIATMAQPKTRNQMKPFSTGMSGSDKR